MAAGCCLAMLLFLTAGCSGAGPSTKEQSVPILMYHHVGNGQTNRWWLTAAEFEAQLQYLRANGYESVMPEDIKTAAEGRGILPARPIVLTFDDGGRDLLTVAEPILTRYGYIGLIYLITGSVGTNEADRRQYEGQDCLVWPEVRAMHARGYFQFGGHTRTSPDLRRTRDLASEIKGCYDDLVRELGIAPDSFCYPFGRYRSNAVEAVRQSGFGTAVTCESKVLLIQPKTAWLELPRLNIVGNAGQAAFEQALTQFGR